MRETYGYIRVSAKDQNIRRQLDALKPYEIPQDNLYIEKQSGKDFVRPMYRRLMKRIQPGDLLILKSIDRLGRNYTEILEQWRILTHEKQVDVVVVDFPLLDTRTGNGNLTGKFVADITSQVLAYVAQAERENIRQRQAEGIAAAQRRGVRFGPVKAELPSDFDRVYKDWQAGRMTEDEVLELCKMKRSTFYARLAEFRNEHYPLEEILRSFDEEE